MRLSPLALAMWQIGCAHMVYTPRIHMAVGAYLGTGGPLHAHLQLARRPGAR